MILASFASYSSFAALPSFIFLHLGLVHLLFNVLQLYLICCHYIDLLLQLYLRR